jgi:branched-subunit amino acid transport protein
MPCLRQSPVSSPWRFGFIPRPVRVGYVVDKAAMGEVFLQVLSFSPVSVLSMLPSGSSVTDAIQSQKLTPSLNNALKKELVFGVCYVLKCYVDEAVCLTTCVCVGLF